MHVDVTLTLQIAFATNPLDPPIWTDVSSRLIRATIRRGRSDAAARFDAGTATLTLDNADGALTPGNPRSPYAADLLPLKRLRLQATYADTTYDLFTGFVEDWLPIWPGGLESETTIRCVDGFAWAATARISYSWSAESSHWRIHSLLTAIGWPSSDRVIAVSGDDVRSGKSAVAAVNLVQTAPLSHMQDVAQAEDGQLFVDESGRVVFQGRHYRLGVDACTTVQATFGDGWDWTSPAWVWGQSILGVDTWLRSASWTPGTVEELPYLQMTPRYSTVRIINDAQITATGGSGTPQIASDAVSQRRYGLRSRALSLPLISDGEALNRATWMTLRRNEPDVEFTSLRVSGLHDRRLWSHILGRQISDRIAVIKRLPNEAGVVRRECWIEGVEHTIGETTWETSWMLSPALTSASGAQPFQIGDPVAGQLDSRFYLVY